jgi:O-antigen ligase
VTAQALGIEVARDRARFAYGAFIAFIATVYSSAAQLVPALEAVAPGKTVIATAALALAWSCFLGGRPFRLPTVAGGGALYLFFAMVVASPLWSLWPGLSAQSIAESSKYLAAFIIAANVLDTRRRIRRAATAIVLFSLFPAIGAIQDYLGGTALVEGTRANWLGVFENPNFLAYHLVVSTPLALALRDALPRARAARALLLLIVGIYAVAILLTGSRGGAVGLAAVLLFWLARSLAHGRFAVGAALAIAVGVLMAPTSPLARDETTKNLSGQVDASAQGRIDAWRTALRMAEANPILGVGAGAFVVGYDHYAPGDAGPARAPHNSFAMIAAELGLPALAIFAAALLGAFRALGRAALRAPPRTAVLARGVQAAIFGFVVCSMTGGYTFTWPIYFCLGLAAAIALRERAP